MSETRRKVPDEFYRSKIWLAVRQRILKRDGWRCVICGKDLHGPGNARVDHILTRKQRPDLALTLTNLRSLCPDCDNKRHAEKGGLDRPPVDVNGYPDGWR